MFLKASNTVTQLDLEDYNYYSQWKWGINSTGYVRRTFRQTGQPDRTKLLHRLIMKASKNIEVDHINGDKLDNRKQNLRLCTRSQNRLNSKKRFSSRSQYKGVCFNSKNNKWFIEKRIHKTFISEIEAAKFYDRLIKLLDGEFAWLNFKEEIK
jgi:hypothetical protein